ncbi:MAG: hypothetical protein H6705_14815 [Myxococcales bacterium]|nr:hypothetical protein [Myxococcales bacterium]
MPARTLPRLVLRLALAAVAGCCAGCSLVIDDPAPFPVPPSDAGPEDTAPPALDFQREDAFAPPATG